VNTKLASWFTAGQSWSIKEIDQSPLSCIFNSQETQNPNLHTPHLLNSSHKSNQSTTDKQTIFEMNFIEDIEEAVEDVRYYEQEDEIEEDDADIQRIEDEQVFEDYWREEE
jgi:hypothetical protein